MLSTKKAIKKKERKHALDKESDQEKKKEYTRLTKKAIKKKKP